MTERDENVVHYPFEMFAKLRRDVASVCRAWEIRLRRAIPKVPCSKKPGARFQRSG
jgi:hypothetical protein